MKLKAGDRVKVKEINNDILKWYLKTNKIYTVEQNCISDNYITLKSVFGLYHCSLFEKVEDMEGFKFGQVCYCGEERHKRYLVASHGHFYYVTDYELVGDGQPFLVERFHRGKVYNSPIKEYSIQEIADALKIDVKDLRIKK